MSDQERNLAMDRKRRILIVEDEPINMEILKAMLSDLYEVIPAENGEQVFRQLAIYRETISLILLDLNLPDMHGMEILRRLKSDLLLNRIPVIVVTADRQAEVESLTAGAIDFIPKPYPMSEVVLARVRRIIELGEDRNIIRYTERDHLTGLYNRDYFTAMRNSMIPIMRGCPWMPSWWMSIIST